MKVIKTLILLGAVFSIAGMAFFQFFVLLASLPFTKQVYQRRTLRQNRLAL